MVLKANEVLVSLLLSWKRGEGYCPFRFLKKMFSVYVDVFLRSCIQYDYNLWPWDDPGVSPASHLSKEKCASPALTGNHMYLVKFTFTVGQE